LAGIGQLIAWYTVKCKGVRATAYNDKPNQVSQFHTPTRAECKCENVNISIHSSFMMPKAAHKSHSITGKMAKQQTNILYINKCYTKI